MEIPLTGSQPVELDSDLLIIPVPGHTKGHTVLLYNNLFLFSGDHFAWSDQLNQLIAFRRLWPSLLVLLDRISYIYAKTGKLFI